MKIGILTFHCAHNYGAVLQCYATQEFLRSKGHNVEIIDYRPQFLLQPYKLIDKNRFISRNLIFFVKKTIMELLMLYYRYKRWYGFESFVRTRLNLSARVHKKDIPDYYDIYIIGSDQVWNPKITKGFDNIYFADFPFKKGIRKYLTYAASMEIQSLSNEQKIYLSNALKSFDLITVREKKLCELLQPLTLKKIYQVVDPTLLIDSSKWEEIVKQPIVRHKYVLVYQVRENAYTMQVANDIAKQIGGIVIEAVAWLNRGCFKNKYQTASPEMFLRLIKHAACIVTTSFHGTAFSIIFNKPFYTLLLNDGRDSRSLSLLDSLGLSDRAISLGNFPKFLPLDFSEANIKLNQLRKDSRKIFDKLYE